MGEFTAEERIEAAKKRLGDLKALHTRYASGQCFLTPAIIIDEMEQIAYSARCYLEGIPGEYIGGNATKDTVR
jgi:hypothetical protein